MFGGDSGADLAVPNPIEKWDEKLKMPLSGGAAASLGMRSSLALLCLSGSQHLISSFYLDDKHIEGQ